MILVMSELSIKVKKIRLSPGSMENPVLFENGFEWVLTNFSLSRHYESSLAKKPREYRKHRFLCNCFLIDFEINSGQIALKIAEGLTGLQGFQVAN
jgi:hypothetical protein